MVDTAAKRMRFLPGTKRGTTLVGTDCEGELFTRGGPKLFETFTRLPIFKYFYLFIYFLWQGEHGGWGGGPEEREKQNPCWAEPTWGSVGSQDPDIMTWAEVSCFTDWASRVPWDYIIFFKNLTFKKKWMHWSKTKRKFTLRLQVIFTFFCFPKNYIYFYNRNIII